MESYRLIFEFAIKLVILYLFAIFSGADFPFEFFRGLMLALTSIFFIDLSIRLKKAMRGGPMAVSFVMAILPWLFYIFMRLYADTFHYDVYDSEFEGIVTIYNYTRYVFLLVIFVILLKDFVVGIRKYIK